MTQTLPSTTSTTARRTTRMAIAGSLMGLVALAGCSTSSDTGVATAGGGGVSTVQPSESPAASLSAEDQRLQFVGCLRDNGVDIPDDALNQGPGAIDLQSQEVQDALKACESKLPNMGGEGPGGAMSEAQQSQFIALAECMRDEGIDFPDPKFDANGNLDLGALTSSGINPSDPKVQAALQACSKKVDFQFPGGGN